MYLYTFRFLDSQSLIRFIRIPNRFLIRFLKTNGWQGSNCEVQGAGCLEKTATG